MEESFCSLFIDRRAVPRAPVLSRQACDELVLVLGTARDLRYCRAAWVLSGIGRSFGGSGQAWDDLSCVLIGVLIQFQKKLHTVQDENISPWPIALGGKSPSGNSLTCLSV